MRLCLMIEGQEGVTWAQWIALAECCERAGLEGLFRSDHYMGLGGAPGGSLDAWATLAGLAACTARIRLGTMVSPATFRHPSVLAREATTVDHISGGRAELGLGAGWHAREHAAFGFPFGSLGDRMRGVRGAGRDHRRPMDDGAVLLRRPPLPARGLRRAAPAGAASAPAADRRRLGQARARSRWRRAWRRSTTSSPAPPPECRALRRADGRGLRAPGPRPGDPRPLDDDDGGRRRVRGRRPAPGAAHGRPRHRGWRRRLAPARATATRGCAAAWPQAAEQLAELREAGVERMMLQHLLHDDLEAVELMGTELAAAIS